MGISQDISRPNIINHMTGKIQIQLYQLRLRVSRVPSFWLIMPYLWKNPSNGLKTCQNVWKPIGSCRFQPDHFGSPGCPPCGCWTWLPSQVRLGSKLANCTVKMANNVLRFPELSNKPKMVDIPYAPCMANLPTWLGDFGQGQMLVYKYSSTMGCIWVLDYNPILWPIFTILTYVKNWCYLKNGFVWK